MAERLTEIWKASDGSYHDTQAKAEYHEEIVIMRGAIARLKDYAYRQHEVRICASGIEEALVRHGFIYDPEKDKTLVSSAGWTGRK